MPSPDMPSPASAALIVPCSIEPIGVLRAGIFVGHDDGDGTVGIDDGTVLINADPVMAIVEGLHPIVG